MADSSRLGILRQLADQVPVANQQLAAGQQAAQTARMQEAVRQAAPTSNITQVAQQTGGQQQAALGAPVVAAAQQTQNKLQSIGQAGLSEQGRGIREIAGENAITESQLSRGFSNQLAQLDRNAKRQMVDESLKFKLDEAGRALLNTKQLVDWAATNARSDEDFSNKVQEIQQVSDRKVRMLEMAQKKLQTILDQGYYSDKQRLDNNAKRDLAEKARAIEEKINREKGRAASRMLAAQGIGTVIGAGIGAFGGPAGAVAGASIGAGLGGMAAGSTVEGRGIEEGI